MTLLAECTQTASKPSRGQGTPRSERLAAQYAFVRQATEKLSRPLSPEDCQIQSMPDASPTKWHLAHTTWFFETFVLKPSNAGYASFDAAFDYLFNSYYNTIGDRLPRPRRGLVTRPSLEHVYAYRAAVDAAMLDFLRGPQAHDLAESILAVVELGLNHEQQHQELILTDIKHALAQNPLKPSYRDAVAAHSALPAPVMEWLDFPGGLQSIGHDGPGFAFDNEGPRHRVFLEPYQLGSRLITVGEYREFMEDGGYRRPELWLSDGWNTVNAERWNAPLYWETDGSSTWSVMTLGGTRPLSLGEPVCHVSFYEADAFARWKNARLPSEAEWEVAVASLEIDGNLLESDRLHPQVARTGTGLAQCHGDVWEWTRSPYTPYPGSRPAEGALGEYNAKFMCNQMVLRGGSCVTPGSHIRSTYRNFFPPDVRWQFSGIRLARDL
jgi:ergothioneine biosynthesis protein EgtB